MSEVSGASERAIGRASGPVLQSVFLAVLDHSASVHQCRVIYRMMKIKKKSPTKKDCDRGVPKIQLLLLLLLLWLLLLLLTLELHLSSSILVFKSDYASV